MKNWDDLRVILALSRHGTMSAAADALNLNTTTVSRRMDRITADAGSTLFVRRGNEWRPTPVATQMITFAETIEQQLMSVQTTPDAAYTKERVVRISIPIDIMADAITSKLNEFLAANCEIKLNFVESETSVALGDADIAIGYNEPKSGRLIRSRVGEVNYNFFCNIDFKDRLKGYVEVAADRRTSSPCEDLLADRFGSPRVFTRGWYCATHLAQSVPLAICMPTRMASRHDGLVRAYDDRKDIGLDVWASFHESRRLDPDVRLALDFVKECFQV